MDCFVLFAVSIVAVVDRGAPQSRLSLLLLCRVLLFAFVSVFVFVFVSLGALVAGCILHGDVAVKSVCVSLGVA